jgi:16S rRNA (cytosine967-C5)-methyltransferase
MTVIDYSAAPGGKTTALAAAMEKRGRLIACDVSETRMGRLGENLARMGLADFVEVRRIGEAGEGLEALREELGGAGLVLVDAPCSGLGTLRRHPEIRWRLRNADLARLAALQLAILERAATLVRPGGRLVYGTCSLAAEENEAVVEAFLQRLPGAFKILPPSEDLPPHLRSRLSASGWLRLLPQREEMDSASAVRLVRVR